METILGKELMKKWETNAIMNLGIPFLVLMEQAAQALAKELKTLIPEWASDKKPASILFLCGNGNNGADAMAAARILALQEKKAVCHLLTLPDGNCSEEYEIQRQICENLDLLFVSPEEGMDSLTAGEYDIVVDGLFGIGLSREVTGICQEMIECANDSGALRVAVDVPSGICSDTGQILGIAFRADVTVTFGFRKMGLCLYPGREYAGRVILAPLDIPPCQEASTTLRVARRMTTFGPEDLKTLLPPRKEWSNKGSYGKILLIAGSQGMAGAACLQAKAALAAGCGLVRVLTPECNRAVLQTVVPEAIVCCYEADDPDRELLRRNFDWADAVVCGSGLGISGASAYILDCVLDDTMWEETPNRKTLVLDGDALNLLPQAVTPLPEGTILTPHLGEMSRLTRKPISELQEDLWAESVNLAVNIEAICVCKDAVSVIAAPDGRTVLQERGCNGMATAGSGDVLAGLIGAFSAQHKDALSGAVTGALVHALAGEAAAAEKGCRAMTAMDLVDGISKVTCNI